MKATSYPAVLLAAVSVGAVLASFAWQGYAGFNIADEGYLWYGAQRVMRGEVPIRDFMSYDPGRYYWSAALMSLGGDEGIVALRLAVTAFQALGLFAALHVLIRDTPAAPRALLLVVAVTLLAWMFPRHKLFDISMSIFLVAVLAFLIRQPTTRSYLLAGIAVGLAAVFGRNHGVYGAAGSIGAIAYLALGRSGPRIPQAFASWAAGVGIGFMPVIFMAAVMPGFAAAFVESIRFLFELGSTNLPLPVPWPWSAAFGRLPFLDASREALVGVFFISVVVFGVCTIAWAFLARVRGSEPAPVIVAAGLMALPYAHFAYSRADVNHLAQGVFPFLIGAFALVARGSATVRWPFAAALCAASLFVMLPLHPGWRCRLPEQCVSTEVGASRLTIDRSTAGDIDLLRNLVERFATGGRLFYVAPFWPGAYAVFDRRSPVWEIYPVLPRNEPMQRAEIQRLAAAEPGFVVILDRPLDGREELRFRNTHPLIYRYVEENFETVAGLASDPAYRIYRSARVVARDDSSDCAN